MNANLEIYFDGFRGSDSDSVTVTLALTHCVSAALGDYIYIQKFLSANKKKILRMFAFILVV